MKKNSIIKHLKANLYETCNTFYIPLYDYLHQCEIDIKDLAKKLKAQLACGGTVKGGKVELQGDHKSKVKAILIKMGFLPGTIEVR